LSEDQGVQLMMRKMQEKNQELQEENKLLNFKVKSTMAKNERLERENEMLRNKIEENTWNDVMKDDNNEG
jgi:FtsZ-binding cell division protein ZapB